MFGSQIMVHWKREWQITSVFLPRESHEQYEKQKDMTVKDEVPRLVVPDTLLKKRGEIAPGKTKRLSQDKTTHHCECGW